MWDGSHLGSRNEPLLSLCRRVSVTLRLACVSDSLVRVSRRVAQNHMTANDLDAFDSDPQSKQLQFKYTARSLLCSQLSTKQENSRTARIATPLSDPSRSPIAITQSEDCYLLQRRLTRFEHSLTRRAEKCEGQDRESERDSPSDLYSPTTPPKPPEFLLHVANSVRFPTNGFTYS